MVTDKLRLYRVRPVGERAWCYLLPRDMVAEIDESEGRLVYEVQRVDLSDEEINALPEFDGW